MGKSAKAASETDSRLVAQNRRARHDFEVLDTFEAGLALLGTEVKALRAGKANLRDGFARVESGQVYLHSVHIGQYGAGNRFNHDPERVRKLLLHRWEIRRLIGRTEEKGLTLVPLRLYFKSGIAKVELGLVRGKRQYDRRREIATRDAERAIDRALAGGEGES